MAGLSQSLNDGFFTRQGPVTNDGFFDPAAAAVPLDYERLMQSGAGELERGVRRGLSGIANTGQAAVGQMAEPFFPAFGQNMIQGAIRDMGRTGQRFAPAVESYHDIHDVGSLGNYVAGKVGEMAPLVPLALGGSALGRAAMRTAAGSHLGGVASFLPQTVGQEAMALQQDPAAQSMSPAGRAVHALSLGAAEAAVGALVPAAATERLLAPSALPRGLGANLGRFAGNTAVGTAAGGAGMAAMDLTGQMGRTLYDPNAQINTDALKEAFVGGMAGTLPFAGAHAAVSHVVDTGKGVADVAGAGARAVGAGVKFVGKELYDAMPDEMQQRLDQAAELAGRVGELPDKAAAFIDNTIEEAKQYADKMKSIVEESPDYSVAAGRVAGEVANYTAKLKDEVVQIAQDTMPHLEAAGNSVLHHMRPSQARLERTIDALTEFPKTEAAMQPLLERESFFRAMADRYDPESPEAATMREAASALAEINEGKLSAEDMVKRWDDVKIAAQQLRTELGGEELTKARQTLVDWLKESHPDAKYSRIIPAQTRADIRNAAHSTTGDNMIDTALDKAFTRIGWSRISFGGERGEISEIIKAVANKMLREGTTPEINRELRTYLRDTFGERLGGEVEGAVHKALDTGKQGSEADAVTGQRDVLSYIQANLKEKGKAGHAAEVLRLIREEGEIVENYSGRQLRLIDLPEEIRPIVEGRLKVRAETGNPSTVSKIAAEEAIKATDAELGKLLSGDVSSVKMRVREMNEGRYGGIEKAMGVGKQLDQARLNAVEVEHQFEDGKYNEGTLHEVPMPSQRTVHDTAPNGDRAVPLTGHTTADTMGHVGGKLGEAQIALINTGSPHSTKGTGSKPARAGGSGYVDVDKVNVLHHVSKMDRFAGQTDEDVLKHLHTLVATEAATQAAKLRADLKQQGITPDRYLGFLKEEYGASAQRRAVARTEKAPWEVFDARRLLTEKYGLEERQAQEVTDLFWAEVKRDYADKTQDFTPRGFFEKFPHHYATSRTMAGGHESLDYYDIAKAVLTDRKAGARNIKEADPKEGVLLARDENGDRRYLDMTQLMDQALGKVRTRDEGISELGEKERYDDNLYLEDGKLNERYAQDMRSALASVALSLAESKEYMLDGSISELLSNPELLLKRTGHEKSDVRAKDIIGTLVEKEIKNKGMPAETKLLSKGLKTGFELNKDNEKEIFPPGIKTAKLTGLKAQQAGILGAGDLKIMRKVNGEQKPVTIDLQALVRHVAAQYHVELNDAPRQVYYAALNEGIRALLDTGEFRRVGKGSLPMPTFLKDGMAVVDSMYEGMVIGDKTYRKEDGTLVSKAGDTHVKLYNGEKIASASRLDFDPDRRAIEGLSGFQKALEKEAKARENPVRGMTDPLNTPEMAELTRQIKDANAEVTALKDEGKVAEAQKALDKVISLNAEKAAKERELVAQFIAEKKARENMAPATKGEIDRLSRQEQEEYARNGKKPYRESLDELSDAELAAKRQNVAQREREISGVEEEPFVPEMDLGGETSVEMLNRERMDFAEKHESVAETAERLPGTAEGARDIVKAGPKEMPTVESVIPSERTKAAAAKAEPSGRKVTDPHLQRFIKDLTADVKGDLREMGDEAVKAYYDAAKTIDTKAARAAEALLKRHAEYEGIDLATGKYTDGREMPIYKGNEEVPVPKTKYSRIVLPDGKSFEGAEAKDVGDMVNHLFNANVTRFADWFHDSDGKRVAGATVPDAKSPRGFFINLSVGAKSMLGSTGMHEALHGLFSVLSQSEHGKSAMEKLSQTLTSGIVQERLKRVLNNLPLEAKDREAILADIKSSPEEAAAYAFQFWATGDLKLGNVGEGMFAKIGRFFRNLLGITKDYERTEAFMNAFLSGDLGMADFKASALEKAFAEQRGDKMMKVVKEHMEPFKKVMHTVFDSSIKAMERLNSEDANTLMRKYAGYGEKEGFIKRVRYESNIHSSDFAQVLNRFKSEDLAKVMPEIHSGNIRSDAAKAVMEVIGRINTYAGRPKDYIPEILDHELVSKNRAAFDAAIKDFGVVNESSPGKSVLDILTDMGWNEDKTETTHFLPQYPSERAKWMQNDLTKFMRSMIVNTVRGTERNKIFKPQEVETLLARIQQEKGDEAYYKARDFVDGMEGRLGRNMSPAVRNMMKAAMVAGNILTLPLAVFSAMADPFHLAARSNNLGDAAAAYAKGIGSVFRSVHEIFGGKHKNTAEESFAEETGAIEHAMLTDLLGDVYLNDSAEGTAKKINDWFFKANMLDGWTRQTRVAAVTAAQRFIRQHSGLDGKDAMTKHSKHFMEELGLKAEDVKARGDGNLELNDKVKMAINKFVDQSIVRPDQATNAIWMNDPRFMLLTHMKRFTYAFNDVVLDRVMKEAGRGNLSPLAILSCSIPAILMADMGKHLLKGDYDTWSNSKNTFGKWLDYGMTRSGMTGKFQFGLDAVHDAQMGGTPFDSALGPDLGLLKKALAPAHHAQNVEGGALLGLTDDAFMLTQAYRTARELKQGSNKEQMEH